MNGTEGNNDRLMSVAQVAEILQVNPQRVYELARKKMIPIVRLGRQIRVSPIAMADFLARGGSQSPNNSYPGGKAA